MSRHRNRARPPWPLLRPRRPIPGARVPRSTASISGGSAADARPARAGSEFVRAADMVQWLGQVKSQFGLFRDEMLAVSAKTDASIAGIQDAVSTCAAVRPPRHRAPAGRGEPGHPRGPFPRRQRRARAAAAEVAARGRGCPLEKVGPSTALDSPGPYPPCSR